MFTLGASEGKDSSQNELICGGQNGISKVYAATRALGLTKVPNIPLKQVAN